VLSACGQNHPAASTSIDASTQARLRNDVRVVATALAGHNLNRARAALTALTADTAAAHAAGKLSNERLARIRDAVAALSADLDRLTHTPTPTVTVTTTSTPPPPAPQPNETGHGSGKGNGGKKGGHGGHKDDGN
jgi:hypothetical protein